MNDMRISQGKNQKQRTNAPRGWAEEWDSTVLFNLEEIEEIITGVGGCDASCDYDRGYDDACKAMIEVFEEKAKEKANE